MMSLVLALGFVPFLEVTPFNSFISSSSHILIAKGGKGMTANENSRQQPKGVVCICMDEPDEPLLGSP